VENVESPNSHTVVEVGLDEIPSTSGVSSLMPCSHVTEVHPFHVIFDINGVLIATHFNKGFCTIIFHPRLKEFREKCLAQFQVYICFATQRHNIYNYLDQIWRKTQIFIHASKVLH